jgi:hypothetical protein
MGLSGYAQNAQTGNVVVIQDERVDTLMNAFIDYNEMHHRIDGWRVEIFFEAGNYSKKLAMEAKAEFVEKYPEVPCYVLFQQPYYKVRIGDVRTKMEAEKLLKNVERDYPNAFVVTDDINYPDLK